MKQTLSEAIDSYIGHRRSEGMAPATIRNEVICLRTLLKVTGNLYVENIHEGHIDEYFNRSARSPRSLTVDHSTLKAFSAWALRTRRAKRDFFGGRRRPKFAPREWRGVHVSKFPALLDAARNPRDRILVASGLYLLGRSAEYTDLRIEDVRLDASEITYRIGKTFKVDGAMPIVDEYDDELRPWLKYYARECGPLQPHWYLIPGKTRPRMQPGSSGFKPGDSLLVPTKKLRNPHEIAKRSLQVIGFQLRDPNGKSRREGTHTLRRSCARALYEQLLAEGDPRPVETVRATLHHSSEVQTREYIGLPAEYEHRNKRLKGKRMFPSLAADNVRKLEVAGRGVTSGD